MAAVVRQVEAVLAGVVEAAGGELEALEYIVAFDHPSQQIRSFTVQGKQRTPCVVVTEPPLEKQCLGRFPVWLASHLCSTSPEREVLPTIELPSLIYQIPSTRRNSPGI